MAGIGNIFYTSLQPPLPVPATVTAANNGTSLNGTTVVLGNNVGGILATLLSNRQIPLAGFNIQLTGGAGLAKIILGGTDNNGVVTNRAGRFEIKTDSAANAGHAATLLMTDESTGGFSSLIETVLDVVWNKEFDAQRVFRKDTAINDELLLGADPLTTQGGGFASGSVTGRFGCRRAILGYPGQNSHNLAQNESNALQVTESSAGGVLFNIATGLAEGTTFIFSTTDGQSCQVQFAGTETCRVGALTTTAAGSVTSAVGGSVIRITNFINSVGAVRWIAEYLTGTWVVA
jgi:hypothetical protein